MTNEQPRFLDRAKIEVVGFIGAALLRLIDRTLRWEHVFPNAEAEQWTAGAPIVMAFWHGHQLFMPSLYRAGKNDASRPIYALISQHTDGRMIARAVEHMGIRSVAGSSTRGGRAAVIELVDRLRAGCHIAITPDGPKGPCYQSKTGVVRIAQKAQAAILPTAIGAERRWTFGSWDRMFLPKPFSRAVQVVGEPFRVPEELDENGVIEWTQRLDEELNKVRERAENYSYGRA